MAIADDLRKTLTDPTPLYFAAGTADIAVEQARKVPGLIEQLRAEAPDRIDALRTTDPKERAQKAQAAVQAKVAELLGSVDTDPRKLRETAQGLALRGVGVAAEYAVKARETYERVAERGEQSVRAWRGEAAEDLTDIAVAVEPDAPARPTPVAEEPKPAEGTPVAQEPKPAPKPRTPRARTAAPRKAATVRKPPARKPTPPADGTTTPGAES
jgi:heparin binding hemagglutinin HbhA